MKRLTIRNGDGSVSQLYGVTVEEVFYCLAEYEDTGLEPEEIKDNMDMLHAYRHICAGREPEHISELLQAEQDGRLVVLPCKVGDTVYRVIRAKNGSGHVAPANVSGLHLGDTARNCRYRKEYEYVVLKVDGGFCAHVNKRDFGKTVFLTREEAEAALKGGEG